MPPKKKATQPKKMQEEKEQEKKQKIEDQQQYNRERLGELKDELEKILKQATEYADCLLNIDQKRNKQTPQKRGKKSGKQSTRKRRQDIENPESNENSGDEDENEIQDYLTTQPTNIKTKTLFDHQIVGLNWLISLQKNRINGILADDMGLGKTLQSVSIIAYLRQFKNINGPHLIVGPLAVLQNWKNEFNDCLPDANVLILHATKEQREENLKVIKEGGVDVIITSYEGVQKAISDLKKIKFQYFILDEAHKIKNDESLLAKTIQNLPVKYKLLLTGTPLQNNLHELWSLLNYIMPDMFSDPAVFDEFTNLVHNSGLPEQEKEDLNVQFVKSLHQILAPFMLRRAKSDALTLPAKRVVHVYTGLTALQVDIYKKLLAKKPIVSGAKVNYNNTLMQLRKTCCHPYLFPDVEDPNLPVYGEHLINTSGKMVVLDKLITKLKKDTKKHQILIFSQFTIMLDILQDFCDYRKHKFVRIDGNVTLEERNQHMSDFIKEDSDIDIFLLSTRAGGLGINLYTADTVIIYDSDWNPQSDLQAIDRAHRIGQKNEVMVYRLITDQTVDEKMIERQQIKLKWDQHVIQQGRHIQQNKFGKIKGKELNQVVMFGAETIFKSEGGTLKDEDIDQLLKRGEQRTKEEEEKLQQQFKEQLEKIGDLSLNSINVFESLSKVHEKDKQAVDEAQEQLLLRVNNTSLNGNYSNTVGFNTMTKEQLLTRRLLKDKPQMIILNEHQLYDNLATLEEYLQREKDANHYAQILSEFEKHNVPIPIIPEDIQNKMAGLSPQEEKLKKKLLQTGFNNWSSKDFKNLISLIVKYGKTNYSEIAENLKNKTEEEVEQYCQVLYSRLEDEYLDDSKKITQRIEQAEKKRKDLQVGQELIEWKCKQYDDPLNEIEFEKYLNSTNSFFDYRHDQWLLWANYTYGYKNWEKILLDCRKRFFLEPEIWTQETSYYTTRLQKLVKLLENESGSQHVNVPKKKPQIKKAKTAVQKPNKMQSEDSDSDVQLQSPKNNKSLKRIASTFEHKTTDKKAKKNSAQQTSLMQMGFFKQAQKKPMQDPQNDKLLSKKLSSNRK